MALLRRAGLPKYMNIALLQHNFIVGDIVGNAGKIRTAYERASKDGAAIVLSTELALLGYPPRDLLERKDIINMQLSALYDLAKITGDTALVVGFAELNSESRGKPLFNAAAVLRKGKIETVRRKALLPTYDVFDEYRYFDPYLKPQEPIAVAGKKFGLLLCEDIWNGIEDPNGRKQYHYDPVEALVGKGIDGLLVINGSPYWWGKGDARLVLAQNIAKRIGAPVFYSNQVGGNDELIFDGRSFAVDKKGQLIACAKTFTEDIVYVDLASLQEVPWVRDTQYRRNADSALIVALLLCD